MTFFQPYIDSLDATITTFLIAAALVLLSSVYYWIKYNGTPPGPTGLPYLGLYPSLTDDNVLNKLEEYKKKYGEIFSFTFTGRLYIHLGSIKAMREIHLQKSDCFADRFKGYTILAETVNEGKHCGFIIFGFCMQFLVTNYFKFLFFKYFFLYIQF